MVGNDRQEVWRKSEEFCGCSERGHEDSAGVKEEDAGCLGEGM